MWATGRFGPLLNTQTGGISINELVVPADQMSCLRDIVDICGGDSYGMYQAGERVHANSVFEPLLSYFLFRYPSMVLGYWHWAKDVQKRNK